MVWSLILWVALLASISASPDVMENFFGGIIPPGAYEYVYVLLLLAFPIEITTWLCDVGIMAYIAHPLSWLLAERHMASFGSGTTPPYSAFSSNRICRH